MQPTLCARCHKNVAVIFITKIENGNSTNEGLCLKCAKEMNIKPVNDIISKMGISDDELENISKEMLSAFGGEEDLPDAGDDNSDDGKTATFPFLNRLFSNQEPQKENDDKRRPGNGASGKDNPSQNRDGDRRSKRKFLDSYCICLTQRARDGQLDRIVGREEELERVIQILNRRQKNNPCLIGEPGVGKTAIAEGLSIKIAEGAVPYKLRDKEVWLLDLTSLVAGTQFRGQFESRMKGLIDEIKRLGNIILVIDEVHNLVGAGDAEGSMNAANILKPALSRGEIQVIGATTFNEYRKHIEKDSALERRFQPVTVNEPSIDESIEILKGIAHYYELHHGVRIPEEMCRQAVLLSERYITDRFLPDKAIDLIDEACSDVNLKNKSYERIFDIQKDLDDIAKERDMLLEQPESENQDDNEENYKRLATLRGQELALSDEKLRLEAEGMPVLELGNLARIIELWTKIPASSIKEDEGKRLAELDERLKKHIIGQDEAVDAVCSAIKRNRVGISPKRKPASFIFVGSTGVGKTELVKRLAEDMFQTPEALIRLDMSEFMEKFSVSRIIGSPPGYVGYDEAGQLTEKIRRKPYSVVLFDEIEKAHPDVMNILLQILDDGRITDAHGRTVNFENTIIIMTTNAGSDKKGSGSVGFGGSVNDMDREKAMKALRDFLRPEFINRVDEIVYFNHLTEENFRSIADLMMREQKDNMAIKGISLEYDDSVLDYLTKRSYSVEYGARNLRRTIQKEIEDVIAREIVDNYERKITRIGITAADGAIQVIAI